MTILPCTKRGPYRNSLSICVEKLDWPAQSPDLNPIEHLGMYRKADCEPGLNRPNITNALVAEWKQVPAVMFQHLLESLPRRVEAVIAAKGEQVHINTHDFWNEMFDEQMHSLWQGKNSAGRVKVSHSMVFRFKLLAQRRMNATRAKTDRQKPKRNMLLKGTRRNWKTMPFYRNGNWYKIPKRWTARL
uniref:Tc1-like transposase DDE domain-containing protein n=1 Tax=Hucho hucho TaxID=62062 RepID=A0A4W5KX62_9TELE